MTPVRDQIENTVPRQISWAPLAWFAGLLIACYAPVLIALIKQWNYDADMGHGFFVPFISGFIAWQKRDEVLAQPPTPNWWGLLLVGYGALQLYVATLGAEIFLARTAFVISVIGMVLLLCGTRYVRILSFPLFLLFFMVPIPAIIYNKLTFPLQILATQVATRALDILQVPVIREGNILHLSETSLSVVEACSGIRSLLSLTFLSLVYGFFFETRNAIRVALFFATIPIAILANASRVTLTGVLTEYNKDLAEGFFHSAEGWVIFMVALLSLLAFHQIVKMGLKLRQGKRG
jgi:exosortase